MTTRVRRFERSARVETLHFENATGLTNAVVATPHGIVYAWGYRSATDGHLVLQFAANGRLYEEHYDGVQPTRRRIALEAGAFAELKAAVAKGRTPNATPTPRAGGGR